MAASEFYKRVDANSPIVGAIGVGSGRCSILVVDDHGVHCWLCLLAM